MVLVMMMEPKEPEPRLETGGQGRSRSSECRLQKEPKSTARYLRFWGSTSGKPNVASGNRNLSLGWSLEFCTFQLGCSVVRHVRRRTKERVAAFFLYHLSEGWSCQ